MIIWIASYPKSGNTLLRSILCSLIATDDGVLDLKKLYLVQGYPQKKFFHNFSNERIDIKEISKYWISSQKEIIANKKYKFLKTHNANCKINNNFFTTSEVTAGVIYIVRDPRDVVCSASTHFDLSVEETKNVLFDRYGQTLARIENPNEMTTFLGSWSDNLNYWLNFNRNILLIKYEDLVLKKKDIILKILDYLNLFFPINISQQKLDNCLRTTSFKNVVSLEEQGKFGESVKSKDDKKIRFFNKGIVGGWRDVLDKKVAREIEFKFKKEMIDLGYL